MEKQYFTPSIEDIRVGYECEMLDAYNNWRHFVFEEHLYYEGFGVDFGKLRVPYLTIEQIEAEGWKAISDSQFHKNNIWFSFQSSLEKVTFWEPAGNTLFEGECKDINTFRYICKLLNI